MPKTNDKLVIKLVSFGGKLLDTSDVGRLADLPTKDEAISQLMSVMKAPIAKFVQDAGGTAGKACANLGGSARSKAGNPIENPSACTLRGHEETS